MKPPAQFFDNSPGFIYYIHVLFNFQTPIEKARINNEITASELRIIGAQGENLGVMSREEALRLVRPGEGLDLILIAPGAKPPVARIMSYDKFRYEREKAYKKERLAQKAGGVKRVQLSARAAQNDLLVKVKKLEEFLEEGRPVEVFLRLRGREKGMRDWAESKMREFFKMIKVEYKMVTPPKFGGQGYLAQIVKK
ncbi:MAG: translation initiation factor IF-3 [Candidatus Liptonbacteria bacterium]